MTAFPEVIDSSMLNTLRSCPQAFAYAYCHNLVSKGTISVHLLAGSAMASGLQAAREAYHIHGADAHEAEAVGLVALTRTYGEYEPEETHRAKAWQRVAISYASYLAEYPLATDYITLRHVEGIPAVEFSFAIPLPLAHPETGNPLLLAGRMDWLGSYKSMPVAVDEKSTGKNIGDKWDLRAQFQAYMWACAEYGFPVKALIVRRIIMHMNETKFQQVLVYNKSWSISRWYEQTLRDIARAITMYKSSQWDMALGDACNAWGGCAFTQLCEAEQPELWIPVSFESRNWNPLQHIKAA